MHGRAKTRRPHRITVHNDPTVERIDHRLAAAHLQAQQKMTGRKQAASIYAVGPCGMDVENSQSNRQPAAPVDDADKIGIVRIVILRAIALIGETPRDDRSQRIGCTAGISDKHRFGAHCLKQFRKMRTVRRKLFVWMIHGRENQRCLCDVMRTIARLSKPLQIVCRRNLGHGDGA